MAISSVRGIDLIGQQFGKLTVVSFNSYVGTAQILDCRCECGEIKAIRRTNLVRGASRSCGKCSRGKHNMTRSPEYSVWKNMRKRCTEETTKGFHNYGGRGVCVCDEWLNDFQAFLSHVGFRPTANHTIERIDNNGNYEPGNVRWATRAEQAKNRRDTVLITFNNETHCMKDWAAKLGLSLSCLRQRLRVMPLEIAMTNPRCAKFNPRTRNGERLYKTEKAGRDFYQAHDSQREQERDGLAH